MNSKMSHNKSYPMYYCIKKLLKIIVCSASFDKPFQVRVHLYLIIKVCYNI